MGDKLCLLVCNNFEPEARRVLESRNFEDIEIATFPAFHLCKSVNWDRLESVIPPGDEYASVRLIGGGCLGLLEATPGRPENCEIDRMDQCFELFAPPEFIDDKLGAGAYLVTPGWLSHWRRHIDDWGFDRRGAREFFGESMRSILLLDTGIDDKAQENLRQFCEFTALPGETATVGLGLFTLHLDRLVLQWRLERERRESRWEIAAASKRAADFAMLFDLISELALVGTEGDVVSRIFELHDMLFAPGRMVFYSLTDGRVRQVWSRPESIMDDSGLEGEPEEEIPPVCAGARGFRAEFAIEGETLGILDLCDIALPEYEDRYREASRSVSAVCCLALANARTYRALELANIELSGFAHTVSHDLKGPLAAMLLASGAIRAMFKAPLGEEEMAEMEEILAVIERNIVRSNDLIVSLLELAEAGRLPGDVTDVDVREIVESVADERAGALLEKGARLEIEGDLGLVRAGAVHVYQVFSNLIGNSIKHGVRDSPVIRVYRAGDVPGRGHRYVVRDNGPGIPPEDLEKIFVPFYKGRVTGETGIGLSTVQKIVASYRGDIKAYNDGGACFEFTLRDAD